MYVVRTQRMTYSNDNIFYEHTQRGNERPPTKKFSASPLIKNIVANPTTTKIQIATMTAMANPCVYNI